MKTPPALLSILAVCCLAATSTAHAEDTQGLSEQEMSTLYGEDFAKEAMDARNMMDEEWDEDTIDEDAEEEEPAALKAQEEPAPAEPQPAVQKADETVDARAAEKAKEAEQAAAKAAEKAAAKAKALRKKMLESTVDLVKSKRTVDAKIRSSRNSIDQQRAKIAAVQEKLEKKRDKALAKNDKTGWGRMANDFMDKHPEWQNRMPGGQGGRGGHGGWGGKGGWGAPALPQASAQDKQTVKNAQKSIKELKKAIPQLVVLSYQMSERIESQLETLGNVENAVLRSYDPDTKPEKEGCETEQAAEDTYKPR